VRRNADQGPRLAIARPATLATTLAAALALAAAGAWYATRPGAPGGVARDRYGDLVQTVAAGQVPAFAQQGGKDVADVYRFAASEEGKVLEWMPCYCGCGGIGHQHNRHCYIKQAQSDTVTFTSHGGA
jgi:hypothetical protein